MTSFTQQLEAKLAVFSSILSKQIQLNSQLFSFSQGTVADYIEEIRHTAMRLESNETYSDYFATQLVRQFDALKQAVERQSGQQTATPTFRSPYRFSPYIHRLSPEKRLIEYRKALRALNEKLAWLSEQSYLCDHSQRSGYIAQIEETEYRKKKCLQAIEDLERSF